MSCALGLRSHACINTRIIGVLVFFYSCYTVIEFVSCCFSVGIEDAGDLVADLTQALEKVK